MRIGAVKNTLYLIVILLLKWQNIFVKFDKRSINNVCAQRTFDLHLHYFCSSVQSMHVGTIRNKSILILDFPGGEEESLWVSTFQLYAWHHQHQQSDARRDEGEGEGGAVARIVTWSIWNMYLVSWLITAAFLLSCTWPLRLETNLREVS